MDKCPHHDAFEQKINDIHKVIYGNGREGLNDRMIRFEEQLKTDRNENQFARKIMYGLFSGLYVALIAAIIVAVQS